MTSSRTSVLEPTFDEAAAQACSASRPRPTLSSAPPIAIMGVPFDNVTTQQALERIQEMLDAHRAHYLVTANVDFVAQARKDIELRRILFEADMVLCDGTPLVWASRWLGNPLPERVAGADIVPLLIGMAVRRRLRLFFLGASSEASERAVSRLRREYPEVLIVGHYSPPFKHLLDMNHEEIKRRIIEAKPDFLFVSLGCPKQEKWIAMHYQSLGVPISVGVGATIDFLAGQVRRAPVWMQRIGAEWIFRLAQEPRRLFSRYCHDLWFFAWSILAQWWQLKKSSKAQARKPTRAPMPNGVRVEPSDSQGVLSGTSSTQVQAFSAPRDLDMAAIRAGALKEIETMASAGTPCALDMKAVEFVDSTGIGALIRLQKKARSAGSELALLEPGSRVLQALKLMRLVEFFTILPGRAEAQVWLRQRQAKGAPVLAQTNDHLVWRGEITSANAEAVWQHTRARLDSGSQTTQWTIDMSQVRFMDSTGLGLMIRVKKLARRNGANLSFAGLTPAVRNVIQISKLEQFLDS